jgi:hypothetical protein
LPGVSVCSTQLSVGFRIERGGGVLKGLDSFPCAVPGTDAVGYLNAAVSRLNFESYLQSAEC